jgi:hypothetical protein
MAYMARENAFRLVAEQIAQHSPQPTELLTLLEGQLSYGEIQEAVVGLIDSGEVVLDPERHLRIKQAA